MVYKAIEEKLKYHKGKKASWRYKHSEDLTKPVTLTNKIIEKLLSDHSVAAIEIYFKTSLTLFI